jgi:hypothetical protein
MMVVMVVDGGKTSKVRKFGRVSLPTAFCHFHSDRVKHHHQPPSPPSFAAHGSRATLLHHDKFS